MRGVEYRTTSLYAAEQSIPRVVAVRRHQVDLALVVTDYKVQGKTLEYFILSIGPRDGNIRPSLKLVDLYVLASRVRLGRNLYVIGLDPRNPRHLAHLRKLRPCAALAIWESGYDADGVWDDARARHAAAAMVAQQAPQRRRARPARGAPCHE